MRAVNRSPRALKSSAYLELTYSETRAPASQYPDLLAQWLLDHVFRRPGRLLELGCGRGDYLRAFSRLGFDVAGIDISPRAAEFATGLPVELCDLGEEPIPFSKSSFDFVFAKSLIEHMREPMLATQAALETLKDGGVAAFMTPSWEHMYWGPFYIDHTHVTPFTPISLDDVLTLTGFDDVRVRYFYQLPFTWRHPQLLPLVRMLAVLPLPYRPYRRAPWSEPVNKLVRFSKEVMLLGVGRKPANAG